MTTIRGLIAAGGEATRLQELTRVANKHLLPVGRWPMIYYPLQLLQLAGIREVLIVTGQGHAGQLIDLLGDGRIEARGTEAPLFDLDLTYKVQTHAGGIAQVVGMAESFAAGGKLVVCLGDNLFEHAQADDLREFASSDAGALIFVKEVPDPERFGVVVYGDDGRVVDVVEKAGVVDTRYPSPPTSDAVVGLYGYDAGVFDVIRGLEPSSRGELEITDVNRVYAREGRLEVRSIRGWWHDAGTHEALAELAALVERTGANKTG
jgi:glucose-1-phosphate thymidylyltransferase